MQLCLPACVAGLGAWSLVILVIVGVHVEQLLASMEGLRMLWTAMHQRSA
jgi:hypothetical protein